MYFLPEEDIESWVLYRLIQGRIASNMSRIIQISDSVYQICHNEIEHELNPGR